MYATPRVLSQNKVMKTFNLDILKPIRARLYAFILFKCIINNREKCLYNELSNAKTFLVCKNNTSSRRTCFPFGKYAELHSLERTADVRACNGLGIPQAEVKNSYPLVLLI